ncbi:MAG: hypothetical protein QF375_03840 [Arenicellales bacterium]|jgi:hypothetical protein|nr:hypothetical protein [Arenicellales bacterium]
MVLDGVGLRRACACATIALLLGACAHEPFPEKPAQIRFYRLDNQNQPVELSLIPNRAAPGCHNLPLALDLHRVAQVGFSVCSVYAASDCSENSILMLRWAGKTRTDSNKRKPTTRVTPGALWLFDDARETTVRSWRCHTTD